MSLESVATPPSVLWAQRDGCVLLTFNVECDKPEIKIEKKLVSFKGICMPDQKLHEVEILLYDEIDPEKSSYGNKGRFIEVVLCKEKNEGYWPSLTGDKKKHHWLRVDFNRWKDEDESIEDCESMEDMFSDKMSGLGDNYKNDDSSCNEEDLADIE